jgi:HipA-like kinase
VSGPRRGVCVQRVAAPGGASAPETIRFGDGLDPRLGRTDKTTADGTATPRIQAREFVRRMRGASQPWLVRCEDGQSYVVKFQNNPQHARVLANEMLASRLARLVGLPAAAPAFIDVQPAMLGDHPHPTFDLGEGEPIRPGLHFGSRFPGAPSQTLVVDFLPDRLLRRVLNLHSTFLGGLVFDKWTCNCDSRQVIFHRPAGDEGASYSVAMIDQGFCFNDGDWSFPDSPLRGLYPRRLVYEKVTGLDSFEPFLSRIENVTPADVEMCTRGIPADWCDPDPGQLVHLAEILYARRRTVRQAIIDTKNSSLAPFPNWA